MFVNPGLYDSTYPTTIRLWPHSMVSKLVLNNTFIDRLYSEHRVTMNMATTNEQWHGIKIQKTVYHICSEGLSSQRLGYGSGKPNIQQSKL